MHRAKLTPSAVDNQMFVSMCSPSRNQDAAYQAYGHSMVVNPLGEVMVEADENEAILYADIGELRVERLRRSRGENEIMGLGDGGVCTLGKTAQVPSISADIQTPNSSPPHAAICP
jgi:hypothetical protein